MDDHSRLTETRELWDAEAATFDEEPDHGLRDSATRAAWAALLGDALRGLTRASILDIGCGTGTLSVLLGEQGHRVTGIDASPAMLARAGAKAAAAGLSIPFYLMDAARPDLPPRGSDALVCRHLLWALPEPANVLRRWVDLLRPGGRLVLVEGSWNTGGGLHATDVLAMLPESLAGAKARSLSDQPALWGGPVTDERYIIIAGLKS